MGLLSEGSPLSWEETKKWSDHVHKHGILQFISLYHRLKNVEHEELKWGDEVEYTLIKLNHSQKSAKVLLKAQEMLEILQAKEKAAGSGQVEELHSIWRPEYASYMVEGTPGTPYGGLLSHFNIVEANMRHRREEMMSLLDKSAGETALSVTVFPRLGCPDFTEPHADPKPYCESCASRSLYFPDEAIFPGHPRFATLTRNIRCRRKEKVAINVPVFKDINTKSPFQDDFSKLGDDGERGRQAIPDHIYMDAMGFGMGCSCLQMTFQACNLKEARLLYDQLTPLCPIVLALSAAAPTFRGCLADVDARWDVIAKSVDDRTREERGLEPLKHNKFVIKKSRYDSVDMYISEGNTSCNDVDIVHDRELYEMMVNAGIDQVLAKHIAHLFIRDPVSLFSEKIHQCDKEESDHFENIQSTNWQTMRFKPPPPYSPIGWRIEFRPCEVQLTDFENAAYVVFVVLLTRVILSYNLNFVIPISKVDENMAEAQKRDAVLQGKFWFAKDLITCNSPAEAATCYRGCKVVKAEENWDLMTINEIINGKLGLFPGLIPMIQTYLESVEVDVDTSCTINQYLKLIEKRASGELKTFARWSRDFIQHHPDYKHDSIVTEKINYDFMALCDEISTGAVSGVDLFGVKITKTTDNVPTAVLKANKDRNHMYETS